MRDFYPEEMFRRRWLEDLWREVSQASGLLEYDGPILEHLDLFTAKSGQEISEQLFSLTDRAGRGLAIRPEITPTLARMVNERVASLPKPIRWFSIARLCRGEQPQRGRLREFFQWNVDILGADSPVADAEAILVAIDLLRRVGLGPKDVVVRISSRALLGALLEQAGFSPRQIDIAYRLLDKRGKIPDDAFQAIMEKEITNTEFREALEKIASYRTLKEIQLQPDISDRVRAASEELAEVFSILQTFGVADYCSFDIGIVRGLAYYTGTVFEIFDRAGEFRAIGGGGRFDDLLKALGGPSMPAVGFGMGDVVLMELLAEKGLLPQSHKNCDFYVVDTDISLFDKVLEVVARLRSTGKSAQFSYKRASLVKQLKLAANSGAKYCVIIGEETTDDGLVTVKNMANGKQVRVAIQEFLTDPGQVVE